MDRALLLIASALAFLGVAFGAFGSHALRSRLSPERLSRFETGVRYQLWHALGLFAAVFVGSLRSAPDGGWFAYRPAFGSAEPWPVLAGWLFVAGIVLFSGSLYVLALTDDRRWGAVTPFGGLAFLLGWLALFIAILTI